MSGIIINIIFIVVIIIINNNNDLFNTKKNAKICFEKFALK